MDLNLKNLRPLLIAPFLALGPMASAQVLVNEVSASNWDLYADNFGEYEDWIELYNTSPAPVDLGGWYISDSQNNNTKFQFPAGASIPGNGHLVVFCSGRNQSVGNVHHTNFRLNQTDEERAVLSDPSGTIVSNFKMEVRTKTNHSLGRVSDGDDNWTLFTTPTPGAPNVNPSTYYAPKPELAPGPGFYTGAVNVTITSPNPDTQIRYTLDGSEPNAGSTLYTGAINVAATTVIRAVCIPNDASIPWSFTETNTYFVNVSHSVQVLSIAGQQLPTLLNGTQIEPIGSLEYFAADGTFMDEATGDFNKHGNDSWAYPQRGLDFIARDQFGYNDGMRFPVFRTKDRDHYQRLILKAGASDNYPFENGGAHIRDAFVQALSQVGELRLDERSYEPCVMYVNGQYWGVYEVREKVDDHDFTRIYYQQERENLYFLKTWGGTWQEYGAPNALADWNALRNYIMTNNMGDAAAFDYVNSNYNWRSLVDYFVLNSYIVSKDWLNWNTGWWRGMDPAGDGRRWRYILWDMDACFGHYVNFTSIPDDSPSADPCNAENLPDPGGQGHTELLVKLLDENETVRNFYINRYIDLGNTVFSCDNMIPFLDSLVNLIAPEMPGHVARWGGSVAGWEANVQEIRDFINERCEAVVDGLMDCYDLEGPYEVTFNVNPPGAGRIQINSQTPGFEEYPFTGIYYGGITTSLAARPGPDWTFSHWEVTGTNNLVLGDPDSLATVEFVAGDSIIAHFIPPIRHDITLDVVPRGGAKILFNGVVYEEFPVVVEAPDDIAVSATVLPERYFEFLHWTLENHDMVPPDSTERTIAISFLTTDTLIAWLKPEEFGYYLPNAFSPNGDGINDLFMPAGSAVDLDNYELTIYDRWGMLLFRTDDPAIGWDGSSGGQAMPTGVYVFQADVRDAITKERHQMQGHVTLIR